MCVPENTLPVSIGEHGEHRKPLKHTELSDRCWVQTVLLLTSRAPTAFHRQVWHMGGCKFPPPLDLIPHSILPSSMGACFTLLEVPGSRGVWGMLSLALCAFTGPICVSGCHSWDLLPSEPLQREGSLMEHQPALW